MRKLVCIFASLICSLQIFGDCIPNVEAHIRAPRRFFSKLFSIAQSVYPNPKMQMQTSFALMPFGYPNFNGISLTENALICVYNIETEPILTVALKLDGDSKPLLEQSLQDVCYFHKQDGFLFVVYNAKGNEQEYIESTKKLIADKKISNLAKIKLDKIATKYFLKNNSNKCSDDIESAVIKIDDDLSQINLSVDLRFEKNSPTDKIVNTIKRDSFAEESAFIPQDCEISAISKIILPQNFPDMRKDFIDSILPQENADKIKNMYLKNKGTFAMGINFGSNLHITSVGETTMTQQEFIELAKNNSKIKYGETTKVEVINNLKENGGKTFVESYISTIPANKTYSSIESGYAVCSTNLQSWNESINKINTFDKNQKFPLKKYALDDSDFIVVLNNKSLLKRLLAELGIKIKEDAKIENTMISADIGLGKIRLYTSIDFQILRYYCDLYGRTK